MGITFVQGSNCILQLLYCTFVLISVCCCLSAKSVAWCSTKYLKDLSLTPLTWTTLKNPVRVLSCDSLPHSLGLPPHQTRGFVLPESCWMTYYRHLFTAFPLHDIQCYAPLQAAPSSQSNKHKLALLYATAAFSICPARWQWRNGSLLEQVQRKGPPRRSGDWSMWYCKERLWICLAIKEKVERRWRGRAY